MLAHSLEQVDKGPTGRSQRNPHRARLEELLRQPVPRSIVNGRYEDAVRYKEAAAAIARYLAGRGPMWEADSAALVMKGTQ